MAKKSKGADGEREEHVEMQLVPEYVDRVENLQDQIDDIMQAAKDKAAPLREDIGNVKKEAHDRTGVSRKVFNAKLQERRLRTKADGVREGLSSEHQDEFDQVSKTLGDLDGTPLGQAAKSRELTEEQRRVAH